MLTCGSLSAATEQKRAAAFVFVLRTLLTEPDQLFVSVSRVPSYSLFSIVGE